jgi:predicted phosphodiesterase
LKESRTLRIVVLSDLHHAPGEEADRGLAAAERLVRKLSPDLVLVTGDLTREGLVEQFVPVVKFLESLDVRCVRAIPGNRDFPATRPTLARPVDSDLQYFLSAPDTADLESEAPGVVAAWTPFSEFFGDVDVFERRQNLTLVGLNSEPEIITDVLDAAIAYFERSPVATRIFFTHRALLPVPGKRVKEGDLLVNAGDVLARMLAARVDLIVCAHLHRVHAWQLGLGDHVASVLNVPSLLDSSGGKVNGLKGELRVALHLLDGTPPQPLVETGPNPRLKKRKRKAA